MHTWVVEGDLSYAFMFFLNEKLIKSMRPITSVYSQNQFNVISNFLFCFCGRKLPF